MYTIMTGTITTAGVTGITIGMIGTIDTNYPLRLNSSGEKGTDVAGVIAKKVRMKIFGGSNDRTC